MNDMYAHLNIQFIQRDLNYRINPDFATSPENHTHPHRRETRSGNYWDLNVWLVENIPNDPGDPNDNTSIDGVKIHILGPFLNFSNLNSVLRFSQRHIKRVSKNL